MKYIVFLLVFMVFMDTSRAVAAGPLMHLYLAKLFWPLIEKSGKHSSESKVIFSVGNVFPDIRYLKSLDRSQTHIKDPAVDAIFHKNVFLSGIALHSYVDVTREELAVRFGIYDAMKDVPERNRASALKIVEDIILFEEGNKVFDFPSKGISEEKNFNAKLKAEEVERWHQLISFYLASPEKFISTPQAAGFWGGDVSKEKKEKLFLWVAKAKTNPIFKSYVEAQKQQYERIVQVLSKVYVPR